MTGAKGDLSGTDNEWVEAELIAEDNANDGAADGDVDDLAEGSIGAAELGITGWVCVIERCIGRGRPGADPVAGRSCCGGDCWIEATQSEQEEQEDRKSSGFWVMGQFGVND
jgi:hypothetical protein